VPGYAEDDNKRVYVWFDAVIGYLSASIEWAALTGNPDAWRDWWQSPNAEHAYFQEGVCLFTVIWPRSCSATTRVATTGRAGRCTC
jgi:methionyl-tRNA synthetase